MGVRDQFGEAGASRGGPDTGQVLRGHLSHVPLQRVQKAADPWPLVTPMTGKEPAQGRELGNTQSPVTPLFFYPGTSAAWRHP
ncbi:hypothetical protein ACOMHN_024452 [Nucella lapillus]